MQWYEKLFYQPGDEHNDAWQPKQLEYQFAISAPQQDAEEVMLAEEYYQGRLDWYNLDVDPAQTSLSVDTDNANGNDSDGESSTHHIILSYGHSI